MIVVGIVWKKDDYCLHLLQNGYEKSLKWELEY